MHIFDYLPCIDIELTCRLVCKQWDELYRQHVAIGRVICIKGGWREAGRIYHHMLFAIWCTSPCMRSEVPGKRELCLMAAYNGHAQCIVPTMVGHDKRIWVSEFASLAAYEGHINVLKALRGEYTLNDTHLQAAILGGHRDTFDYLAKENGQVPPFPHFYAMQAIQNGHADMLKHLYQKGTVWTNALCRKAILCNRSDCLLYTQETGLDIFASPESWETAVQTNLCEVVQVALRQGWRPSHMSICKAVQHGSHEMLRLLHSEGCLSVGGVEWGRLLSCISVPWLRVKCAEFAMNIGWQPTLNLLHMSLRDADGLLDTLLSKGLSLHDLTEDPMSLAVRSRSTKLVERMVNEGFPYYAALCEQAVLNGDHGMLIYLHRTGCPWRWRTCWSIANRRGGCKRCLRKHEECRKGRCLHAVKE